MKELQDQCSRFHIISHKGPPPSTRPIISGKIHEFESRKGIEEDIIASLRSEDVNSVGIYGMIGIGKTTMATKIMNRVLKEQEFEQIARAHLGQHVDKSKILDDIGGHLGLYCRNDGFVDTSIKVQKLYARLRCGKKTLIVLDDVWKRFNLLEDFGIPSDSKGCKILITSRSEDVLRPMVDRDFGMGVLSEEDAWFFFREVVGKCVDDPEFNCIAKEIAKGCKGWPIALLVFGEPLIDRNNTSMWRAVLRCIKYDHPGELFGLFAGVNDRKSIWIDAFRSLK